MTTAFSTLPSADVHGLNRVLSTMAQKRPELNQVSQFVKDYDIKTLFLKPSEITLRSKNHSKLAGPITEYLGVPLNLAKRMRINHCLGCV